MKKHLKWIPLSVTILSLAAVAWCLVKYESELLWKAQELNIFLDTPLFFEQQRVASGWLITWLGCWLTEFFYHPALGVAWLTGLWALLMVVTAATFRVKLKWAVVLLVPVALLLLTDVTLGYWVYYLKLRGHFFAATIGVIIAIAAVWLFRLLPAVKTPLNGICSYLRPLFIIVSTATLYPLIGFYALLAALLMGIIGIKDNKNNEGKRSLIGITVCMAVAIAAILLIPIVYYRYVYYQTNMVNIYWTGLPLFCLDEETPAYYIPYYILVAYFILMAIGANIGANLGANIGANASKRLNNKPSSSLRPYSYLLIQTVLMLVMAWGVSHFWYSDSNFHQELRMQRCLEQQDWQGMLNEAANQKDEPTRAIVMMRNLALFRLGRQGDEMYRYPAGAKTSDSPILLHTTQIVGRSIYYNYGQLNFCYRWCLEDGVEMGWRAEYLKYLAKCSLLNGEWRVAGKYLDLLSHTRYHRQWAEHYRQFVNNAEAIKADPEFMPVQHMMAYDDQLASDNSLVEYYLMNHFIQHHSEDPLYQEQELLSALWMKDIQMFWPRFFNYAKLHVSERMPTHYQEAAYLYGHLEHEVDITQMPFDEQVRKDYDGMMEMAQKCRGMTEEQMRPIIYPRYGHTFYFEYFLIRNQKLY